MIVTAVFLSALVCFYGYFRWSRRRLYRMSQDVPDVLPSLPVIGIAHNLIGLDNGAIFETAVEVSEMTNRLQGVSKGWLGPELYYLLTDPDDVVVALNYCLEKNYVFKFLRNWMGNGLVTSEESIWKYRHKKLLPAFNQKLLNGFIPIFNKHFSLMVKKMECESEWFNPGPYIGATNLEIVCQTAMGLPKEQKNVVNPSYLAASYTAFNLCAERMVKVWLYPDFMYRLLGYKKLEDEAIKVLKHASNSVIKLKKAEYENKQHNRKSDSKDERDLGFRTFLDLLLDFSKKDAVFTDEAIREEVDTMISAGQETTAVTAQFVLLLLGSHQDKQEKVFNEIQLIFGNSDRDVTKEDLQKLQYLEATINETLRLYPLVVAIVRLVKKDIKLKTCTLPEGSNIVVLPWGLHRHERWGADYDSFRPERWFEPDCPSKVPGAFCPFGAGKRMCMGRVYAMMSLKTMLINILRKYRVYADIKRLQIGFGIVLNFRSGNEIRIEKRQTFN